MPTPPPRHLATPPRPWRLLLFVFGVATAVLAALVASATLLPQPQPPRRVPEVALPTWPAPTSTTAAPREPTTAASRSTPPGLGQGAISGPTTTTHATAQMLTAVGATTTTTTPSIV